MSKEKHGLLGKIIKICMIIVFLIIGIFILLAGIYALKQGNDYNPTWMSICNIVFGACLLTSPFFFSDKRSGLFWIVKIAIVAIFFIIGVVFITGGAITIARHDYGEEKYKWIYIVNIVFGCLLLTSPYFLKKQ